MSRAAVLSGLAGIALASTALGDEVIFSTGLVDHPDAAKAPPPYGIRLDNLFQQTSDDTSSLFDGSGPGGVTTFSFTNGDMKLQVIKNDSGELRIEITGTVFGGKDTGSGYGFGSATFDDQIATAWLSPPVMTRRPCRYCAALRDDITSPR